MSIVPSGKNRFLVTGATGFVGRCLVEELLHRGAYVRSVVRDSNKNPRGGETFLIQNLDANTQWQGAFQDIDCVVHLAARVHVMKDSSDDPLKEFRKINVEGTAHLAREAARAQVKRFIFLSSIKVNGEETYQDPFEVTDIPNPQDPYGVSKWEAEKELQKIAAQTGMEMVIIRTPLVYGPGVKANFFNLLRLSQSPIPLPLGCIHNRRSMVFVRNLVDALILCSHHENAAHQTFLVSDGEPLSVKDLVRKMAELAGRKPRFIPIPLSFLKILAMFLGKSAVIKRLIGNLEVSSKKLVSQLGWNPPYTVRDGLEETVKWFCRQRTL